MTDEEATEHAAAIWANLQVVESHFPDSRAVALLHARLYRAFEAFIADRPGVVRPYDGTPKPEPKP